MMEEDKSKEQPLLIASSSAPAAFSGDIPPIDGAGSFFREFWRESKKLCYLAGPAIFISLCRYSLRAVTVIFAGHVSPLALAAIAIQNSVIAGFTWGIMLGMGSALETLCGQAFGAGQLDMIGVYLQRSWIVLAATAVILSPLYLFSGWLLAAAGQEEDISEAAGTLATWLLPHLFAVAMNFPMAKFLLAQSKVAAMAAIAAAATALNALLSWLLMLRLEWGLAGAAVALNASWWFVVAAQLVYIFSGTCGRAWSGFSWLAFRNLWGFVRLSLASAVMLCLETWYFMVLIMFAGYFKNAQVSVDALSICMNILGWTITISMGMNAAISVRVSNELGAGHPRRAKFSLVVAVISTFLIGICLSLTLLVTRNDYASLFSNDINVDDLVKSLTPLLALCILVNAIQPVLSGVAIGAGWQAVVAYVNISCYYLFGVPLGLLLGFKLKMGVMGIWFGMLTGTLVQTLVLLVMVFRTDWKKEASIAEDRIRKWGVQAASNKNDIET